MAYKFSVSEAIVSWFDKPDSQWTLKDGHYVENRAAKVKNLFSSIPIYLYISDEGYVKKWREQFATSDLWCKMGFDFKDKKINVHAFKQACPDAFWAGMYVHVPQLQLALRCMRFSGKVQEILPKNENYVDFRAMQTWESVELDQLPAYVEGSPEVKNYLSSNVLKPAPEEPQTTFDVLLENRKVAEEAAETDSTVNVDGFIPITFSVVADAVDAVKQAVKVENPSLKDDDLIVLVQQRVNEDVTEVPSNAIVVKNSKAELKLISNDGAWGRVKNEIPKCEFEHFTTMMNTLKLAPTLTREIRSNIARGYGVALFSTLAEPRIPPERNYFINNDLDEKADPAINSASSSWSQPRGATMVLSPDKNGGICYVCVRVVDLLKYWKNDHPPSDKVREFLYDETMYNLFSDVGKYMNCILLPYTKTGYPSWWSLAAPVFQMILNRHTGNVLTTPGPGLLNMKKLFPVQYDPFSWKRSPTDSTKIIVNPRIEWPPQSVPGQLIDRETGKPKVPTKLSANFAIFMRHSVGLFLTNLELLPEYQVYARNYKDLMRTELKGNDDVDAANENLADMTRLNPQTKLPYPIGILTPEDLVEFNSEITKSMDVLERLSDNQGFVKASCHNNGYLHDEYAAIRVLLETVMGRVDIVEHDNCLFLYPLTAHVENINTTTVVPVIKIGSKVLSDGCGLKAPMRDEIAALFAANGDGDSSACVYFRTIYDSVTGKEDLEEMSSLLLKRMTQARNLGVAWLVHPVPYNMMNVQDIILDGFEPVLQLLPVAPAYLSPLILFRLVKPGSIQFPNRVSNQLISHLVMATYTVTKALYLKFYVAPSAISNKEVQDANFQLIGRTWLEKMAEFMPEEKVEGNAYLPSMKDKNRNFFSAAAQKATTTRRIPKGRLFSDFNVGSNNNNDS